MISTLKANQQIYEQVCGFDIDKVKKDISAKILHDGPVVWFESPDCARIAADTYDVPVCVYNCSSFSPDGIPLTFLPIRKPTKLTINCKLLSFKII